MSAEKSEQPVAGRNDEQFFPSQKEGFIRQAHMLTKENQLQDALELMNKVLLVEPKDQECLTIRALIYWKLKDNDSALMDAKRLVENYPKYAMGYHRLGQAHFTMGNLEEAEKALQEAQTLDVNNKETSKTLEAVRRLKRSGLTEDADAVSGVLYMKKVVKGAGTKASSMDRWAPRHCKLTDDIFAWYKSPKDKRAMGVLPLFTILHVAQLKAEGKEEGRRSLSGGNFGSRLSTTNLFNKSPAKEGEEKAAGGGGEGALDSTFDVVVTSDQTYTFHFKADSVDNATMWVKALTDRQNAANQRKFRSKESLKLVGAFWQDAESVQLQVLQKKLKENAPLIEANLQKKNPRNTIKNGWEPRRVCLYSEFLVYYKPQAKDEDPAGMISIPSMNRWERVPGSPTEFSIIYGGIAKYEIILKEESEERCTKWIEELDKAQRALMAKLAVQESKKAANSVLPRLSIVGGADTLKRKISQALKGGKKGLEPLAEDDFMVDAEDLYKPGEAGKKALRPEAQELMSRALSFPEPEMVAAPSSDDIDSSQRRSRANSMNQPLVAVKDHRTCPIVGGFHFVDQEGFCVNCGSKITDAEKAPMEVPDVPELPESTHKKKKMNHNSLRLRAQSSTGKSYRRPRKSLIMKNKTPTIKEEEPAGPTPEQIAEVQKKITVQEKPEDNLYSSQHKEFKKVATTLSEEEKERRERAKKKIPKGFRRVEKSAAHVKDQIAQMEKKAKQEAKEKQKENKEVVSASSKSKKAKADKGAFQPVPWAKDVPAITVEVERTKAWMPPAPPGVLFGDLPPKEDAAATAAT
eukprot:g64195.t1